MKMKNLSISKIAEVTGGKLIASEAEGKILITGVKRDNREIEPGNLFLCIKGERADGHNFANAAFKAGAFCCLAEREIENAEGPYIIVDSTLEALKTLGAYYRTLFDIPIIGVTGSVGKTSAKEMTAAVLSEKFNVLKTPENLNNEIGVPLTLLSLREEHEAAVIEMGISDFGEMSRLAAMVRPTVCIMTVIGHCHLEALGDLKGVLRAKSEVFNFMGEDGIAVLNGDDENLKVFDPGMKKIVYGLGAENDCHAENITSHVFEGIDFDVCHGETRFPVHLPAFGTHLVMAALAAVSVGKIFDISDEAIKTGLLKYAPVGGRANVIKTDYITIINDCYNANPNSMTAAIKSLAAVPGRKVAIIGDMGELGRGEQNAHRAIGVLAVNEGIDSLICCGRLAEFFYKGLISTGARTESWHFPMKEALFSVLPSLIREGDTVLVKASHFMKFEEIVEELKKLQ